MDIDTLDDAGVLARTLWGEARGEGLLGMKAVACVILNRLHTVNRWPKTIKEVCLQHYQFSCWNEGDPNLPKLIAIDNSDPVFASALDIAERAVTVGIQDITNGATSYYSAWMDMPPVWARGVIPCATIGNHVFFKGV